MKKSTTTLVLGAIALALIAGVFWSRLSGAPSEATPTANHASGEIPVKGMPTMLDLGADQCMPCKMMVPVLEKVEKKYKGKAAIVFIDVWKDKAPAKRFGIRAIPTQIFFDEQGKEVYRHVGFMSEADIDKVFHRMGVSS
ncbi:MAG: thioredoxin family protein [Deltaproteobacteria bacterium]|nr:thioredoxin family protein [Deltaproteobacteria bacterium]